VNVTRDEVVCGLPNRTVVKNAIVDGKQLVPNMKCTTPVKTNTIIHWVILLSGFMVTHKCGLTYKNTGTTNTGFIHLKAVNAIVINYGAVSSATHYTPVSNTPFLNFSDPNRIPRM